MGWHARNCRYKVMRFPNLIQTCLAAAAVVTLTSCATPVRKIASETGEIPISRDLWTATAEYLEFISGPGLTPQNCAAVLGQLHYQLFNTSSTYFDGQIADEYSHEIIDNLFKGRIALRERLGEFTREGRATPECVEATRGALRAARFLEDVIGERMLKPAPFNPKYPQRVFSGAYPSVLVNPHTHEAKRAFDIYAVLRSGDLLMSRGSAFTSAAIARIGNAGSQFSHLALVYIDETTHKKYVIQAEIEVGVIVTPLEDYLADGKVRSALYRYPDAALAARAAHIMFEKVSHAQATGTNIPYNFSLELGQRDHLFCSQVIEYAFALASDDKIEIPIFKSHTGRVSPDFIRSIGVTATETFLPGDVEVDPRLELIAEWRDYSRVRDSRMKDIVLDEIYFWMTMRGYVLQPNFKSWLLETVVYRARRWPLFEGLLKKKFPLNMSKTALGTIALLNDVVEDIEGHLSQLDLAQQSRTGVGMSEREMLDALELYRVQDEARYPRCDGRGNRMSNTHGPKAKFHQLFRPNCKK